MGELSNFPELTAAAVAAADLVHGYAPEAPGHGAWIPLRPSEEWPVPGVPRVLAVVVAVGQWDESVSALARRVAECRQSVVGKHGSAGGPGRGREPQPYQ